MDDKFNRVICFYFSFSVTGQKGGDCIVNGARYRVGTEWPKPEDPNCRCKCVMKSGQPTVDCSLGQVGKNGSSRNTWDK